MELKGKKLGLLVASAPGKPGFEHALRLARSAHQRGVVVFLYCIDDAVLGLAHPPLQALKNEGVRLFACAYAAEQRGQPISDLATFSGLGLLSDLAAETDRFLSFN